MSETSDGPEIQKQNRMRVLIAGSIDRGIRDAIRAVWFTLPADNRTVDELDAQMQRHVARAIAQVKEDAKAFGLW
jgi:hypothetical protein